MSNLPVPCLMRAPGAGIMRVFGALALLICVAAGVEPSPGKQRARADLATAGLTWDENKREIIVTAEGRAKLKDLHAVQQALRTLQPRSLDLSACAALQDVDGLRGLRTLETIYLTACPSLRNVDGIAASDQLKKLYLFESVNIAPASLDSLGKRFFTSKCYLVFPDGTGIHPPRAPESDR